MENRNEAVVLQTRNLLTLQTGLFQIVKNSGSYFLSPYVDDQLDKPYFLMEVVRLKRNFPSLDQGFIELLSERIKEHRFTKKQFHDAINRVIDTCQYPPKISDILSYDKGSRLFTYSEMLEKVNAEGKTTGDFESVANINNKRYYRLK